MIKTYRSFEEYIYDNYYDELYKKINSFLFLKNGTSFLSTNLITNVSRFELDDYHIMGATFNTSNQDVLIFRLSINADVNVSGRTRYDYESDTISVWVSVYCEGVLKNGLHNFKIVRVEEYSKSKFDKETALDHYLVPYLYSDDADNVAENFLRKHFPYALKSPMPLPTQEIVSNMGMALFYAPLNNNIFGKTYFEKSIVTVYKGDNFLETEERSISPGTILVNPNVFFMYNIGTMNNTIIHECVHWERHRMFFELMRLLNREHRFISCECIEIHKNDKANSTPLEWIEWQANTLAPKILMPASTTKQFIKDRLYNLRQIMPANTRDAEVMAQAIQDTADFFQVSRIAAKLRAIELGFEQAHGTYVYIEGKSIPHFSFGSKIIGQNGSFVVDSISALRMIITHPVLDSLYAEDKIKEVISMDDQRFTNEVNDSGTTLVPAKCTNCGGELTVDPTQEAAVCQFCGTPFIVSKAVHNYNVQHNTYQTNIVNQPKKGAVESILDYASERQDKRQQRLDEERRRAEEERIRQQEQKKKRNKTILWVLGWIFIFPVPLTILMLRKKEMNPKVKYGIIAAGWIVYLIFMLVSNHNNNTESVRDYSNDPVVITTTEAVPKTTKATTKATTAVTETKTEAKTTEEAVEETTIEETTIPETEEPTKAELSVSDIKNAIENGDYSLVTPEFKATMDAYEAFFDDYIAFMNNYTSGEGDFMSMMNDYTEMLNKEMEWADKIDAIDESKLSPADDAYYLLVTLRVEKKLLGSIY